MSVDQIRLEFESFQSFLQACAKNVSEEGIFLETDEPSPVGSEVEFDLGLGTDFPILRGRGEVVWVSESHTEERAPGMAVRFVSTDEATATLVRKIADRQRQQEAPVFGLRATSAEPEDVAATIQIDTVEAGATAVLTDPLQPEAAAEESAPSPAPAVPASDLEERVIAEAQGVEAGSSRSALWAIVALIVALAAAGYWQRNWIADRLGFDDGAQAELAAARRERPDRQQRESATRPTEEVAPAESDSAAVDTDAKGEPAEADAPSPESPAPSTTETQPAPAEPSGPLSLIEDIRWEVREGSTVVTLSADGSFSSDSISVQRLQDPPRVLLRIPGVTAPLANPTRAVASQEVVGIRTGLHQVADGSALHVVVDLASPTAEVTSTDAMGDRLQVVISSTAIAP